jgi:hypothetical protein
MATVDAVMRSPGSLAASHALDAEIEASLAGEPTRPDGTVFLPEDLAESWLVEEYRASGSHVAIVSEDGGIELLRPSRFRPEAIVIGLVLAAAVVWAISRGRAATPQLA